jgi:hypothetical protein
MIKAYVWVKPNFGRSSTACSQVCVYENKYWFFYEVFLLISTVSKIFLHKLYKIVSELFLESLKTQKNHTFSLGFLPSFVLFVSYFGG